ncbi:MAG: hypothetical protein ABII82_01970 [Verrucomicrobiota bacterium]
MALKQGETTLAQLDTASTNGLSGVAGSLAYRAQELQRHAHGYERWIGLASAPALPAHAADVDGTTPFLLIAGNDGWGNWVPIFGSTDSALLGAPAAVARYGLGRLMVEDVAVAGDMVLSLVQVGTGVSGAAALAAGTYSTVQVVPQRGARVAPITFGLAPVAAATLAWARCWVKGINAPTMSVHFGIHAYEG